MLCQTLSTDPCFCAAAAAGCGWAGVGEAQVAHEAACPFAICQRMMAPLLAQNQQLSRRCQELRGQHRQLQRQGAALQPLVGRSLGGGGGEVGSAVAVFRPAVERFKQRQFRPAVERFKQRQLQQFESYCEKLYTSPDANERAAAEAALVQQHAQSAPLEGPTSPPAPPQGGPGSGWWPWLWWPWLVRHTPRESPQAAKVLELVA